MPPSLNLARIFFLRRTVLNDLTSNSSTQYWVLKSSRHRNIWQCQLPIQITCFIQRHKNAYLTILMEPSETIPAFVSWPGAPFTESLVRKALDAINLDVSIVSSIPSSFSNLLQWSTYDNMDHELTHINHEHVLSSSYTIRKALVRKHFLSHCIHSYLTKHETSPLKQALPCTWEVDISFADELDEMWTDELWELGDELQNQDKWWIIKPGMADRGMGIRLFNSKESLQTIFEEFEGDSENEEDNDSTAVVTSQLRHFVIQVRTVLLSSCFHLLLFYVRNTYRIHSCLILLKCPFMEIHDPVNFKGIRSVTYYSS